MIDKHLMEPRKAVMFLQDKLARSSPKNQSKQNLINDTYQAIDCTVLQLNRLKTMFALKRIAAHAITRDVR